ncbi:MAG TPA: hypothetical protein VGZ22_23760 [Isosphaeraceae bacterium]|nr:hypothetical protein [Isosphaeraceae bacterium]
MLERIGGELAAWDHLGVPGPTVGRTHSTEESMMVSGLAMPPDPERVARGGQGYRFVVTLRSDI